MSLRELVVLGTSSQAPTRYRNHNGYFFRWDAEGLLFDPGEGTQRQMLLAGVTPRTITRIFVSHFHGDHCLGLPGILQRLNLDDCPHPVRVYFPAADLAYYERLRDCSRYDSSLILWPRPVSGSLFVEEEDGLRVEARPLQHRVPTYGYRITEPGTQRMLPEKLAQLGLRGLEIGELTRQGVLEREGRTIRLEEVSETRRGMGLAFVMDTRPCEAAQLLAQEVDLLVMESTYLHSEAAEAAAHLHCTARETAELAARAKARRLVLAHFSQRYEELGPFVAEASALHPHALVARDFDRLSIPWGRKHPL